MYVFVNNWTHQVSKFMAIYNLCMCKNKIYKRKKKPCHTIRHKSHMQKREHAHCKNKRR